MQTTAPETGTPVLTKNIPSSALHRFQTNLAALRSRQPEVAIELERLPIAEHVAFATGRDGCPTWQFTENGVPKKWLGGTSMPTVSAPILVEGFQSTGGNVWLAGPMCGLEYELLAARTPPYTAIFALVDETLTFKLAMHLYDYVRLFTTGRLAVMNARTMETKLPDFIAANPGYELPQKILFAPQVSDGDRLELQRLVEIASERALNLQQARVREYVDDFSRRTKAQIPTRPRVALLSIDARTHAIELADRLKSSLTKLELPHTECTPTTPDQCHIAARLRSVHDLDAELVIFVGAGAGSMGHWLPTSLPVVSWQSFESEIESPTSADADSRGFCVVDSTTLEKRAIEEGWPKNQIVICEPATDDTLFKRVRVSPQDHAAWQCDVAFCADFVDARPIAAGITLPSHIELWNEVNRLARKRADKDHNNAIQSLIKDAEVKTGVKLTDAGLRKQWTNLVEHRALPSARLIALVNSVANECQARSAKVAILGQGWHLEPNLHPLHRGPIPDLATRNIIYNLARVLVLPALNSWNVQQALDGLSVGCQVFLGGRAEHFAHEYPGLTDLISHLRFFHSNEDLASATSEALRDSSKHDYKQAADLIHRQHTTAHRVRYIIEQVRSHLPAT